MEPLAGDGAQDESPGEPGPVHDWVLDGDASVSLAPRDYDPVARFRHQVTGPGSVTAAISATDAHIEWEAPHRRYGHFSGRPLDPDEIADHYHRQRRRIWARRLGMVAVVLVAAGMVVWNLNNDPWRRLALAEPGTCFQDSLSSVIVRDESRYEVRTTIEAVDCSGPHEFELLGTAPMTGFGDTSGMAAIADRVCAPVFADYVGVPPEESGGWRLASFPPYLQFIAGERAYCAAYQGTASGDPADPYEPVPVVGSARGAG